MVEVGGEAPWAAASAGRGRGHARCRGGQRARGRRVPSRHHIRRREGRNEGPGKGGGLLQYVVPRDSEECRAAGTESSEAAPAARLASAQATSDATSDRASTRASTSTRTTTITITITSDSVGTRTRTHTITITITITVTEATGPSDSLAATLAGSYPELHATIANTIVAAAIACNIAPAGAKQPRDCI